MEGSSFFAMKDGSGVKNTEPSDLKETNTLPLRRARISLILPPIVRVRRKRVFCVRSIRRSSLEKLSEESNFNTSSRLQSGME